MTTNKNMKARVRERMARTGESYAAARAHVAKEGAAGIPIVLPTERRHMTTGFAHGRAYGDYPWDHWRARARSEGLGDDLAELGRSLMREADQHGWCRELRERCGWTEESAEGMIRFALTSPKLAKKHWERLMETDGLYGALGMDELTDDAFREEYRAFALAFHAYFPADRAPAEDPDPLVEIPGHPGVLARRSAVEAAAKKGT